MVGIPEVYYRYVCVEAKNEEQAKKLAVTYEGNTSGQSYHGRSHDIPFLVEELKDKPMPKEEVKRSEQG